MKTLAFSFYYQCSVHRVEHFSACDGPSSLYPSPRCLLSFSNSQSPSRLFLGVWVQVVPSTKSIMTDLNSSSFHSEAANSGWVIWECLSLTTASDVARLKGGKKHWERLLATDLIWWFVHSCSFEKHLVKNIHRRLGNNIPALLALKAYLHKITVKWQKRWKFWAKFKQQVHVFIFSDGSSSFLKHLRSNNSCSSVRYTLAKY